MTAQTSPIDPGPAFLAGGGRAADLIRARDWSKHPMGPPEQWPDAFVSAISLVLNSPESMILCWGPDLHFFFNDTYSPLLGPRVDWAMGALFDEVWADALNQARPIIDDAMAGCPRRFTDLPWKLATDRGDADTWWSFSYSRILDRDGCPAGLFIFTNETTTAVKTEAARREAEEALARAEQAGGVGLFSIESDGSVRGSQHFYRIYGLPTDAPLQATEFMALVDPADRHLMFDGRHDPPREVEYRIRRGDTGERRWIARQGEVERDEAGNPRRFAGIARDVTEQHADSRALAAEREQLGLMFEQAPSFMALLRGPTHIFERVNPSYLRLIGDRDIVGKPLVEALPETADQGFAAILDQVYRTGEPFVARGTPYVPVVDGVEQPPRYCDFVFQPLRDAEGEVAGIFIDGGDVTEGTLATQALAESEERYRTLLGAIEVGFCIIELRFDDEGRAVDYWIVEANAAFERLTGMSNQIGRWVSEFAPDLETSWFDIYGEVARTGTSVRFENEAKPFGRWYDVSALPIGDRAQGRVAVLFNDVTATKQLEQQLRREKEGLEDAVEDRTRERDRLWAMSRDPFLIAARDGTWLAASPAWTELLGWRQDELIGRRGTWMEHPDDLAATRANVIALAKEGGSRRFENRFRTKAGDWRWFAWTVVAADDVLICNARDVTVEKEQAEHLAIAEEQLRQAQKVEAMGQLTGSVAHDFNNLLTVIRGSAELLRRPNLSDDRRRRYTDAIADTADRAARLTSQLLAFARRSPLAPEPFDVGASIAALQDVVMTLAGGGIAIALVAPDKPHFIHADRSQFDTAIVNMAVNARDAMEGEGTLTITVGTASAIPARPGQPRQPGAFVTVALSDTGSGIAADRLDRIFEPFFSTKGLGHGTGLGLSQVYGFAKQSGGEVTVTSVECEGATFTLYLPRVSAPASTAPAAAVDPDRESVRGRVLLVEDNAEVGQFALAALEDLGYERVLANDGNEALARIAHDPDGFDLVFSDVMMPGMSGIELGQAIRATRPGLPVLLTSGYSDVIAAEGAHGFDLLRKPYTLADLAAALTRVRGKDGGQEP